MTRAAGASGTVAAVILSAGLLAQAKPDFAGKMDARYRSERRSECGDERHWADRHHRPGRDVDDRDPRRAGIRTEDRV